jgi:lipoprotein-releasing system ATP-binding protein
VALVAPSGTGKSTLLHLAGLLERPDGGEVFVEGQAAGTLSDDARTAIRRNTIGFVYQFHHLLPEFSALENVVLPQLAAGVSRSQAKARGEELLASSGWGRGWIIGPGSSRAASSSAWRSRGRWPMRPKVLLADEPTGNLDVATSELVFGELLDGKRGIAGWRR